MFILRGVLMKPFCRAIMVLWLILAAAGCLIAFAPFDTASADGQRRRGRSDDGGDSASAVMQAPTPPPPMSAPAQGNDGSSNGASSVQIPQTGIGVGVGLAEDGLQQSSNGNGAANGNGDGQQPHHHHRGQLQGDEAGDDSATATGTQSQGEGQSSQSQGQGQTQGSQDATRKLNAATGVEATRPPRTVEEWLKRVFNGNGDTQPTPRKDNGPGAGEKERNQQAAGQTPAAASKTKPVRTAGRAATAPGELPAAEILVAQLSPKALKRAQQLGFTANGNVALTHGGGMARLLAPPGLSAGQALSMLNDALPGQRMGINETYHAFHAASEPTDSRSAPAMPTPCGTDHCFGSNLIGWRPQLQACAKKVRIGVIDTSFDVSHPTFKRRHIEVRPRALAHVHANEPEAPNWHGTGVLSILAGEPTSGTPGLIPDGHYLVADVFFADANGLPVSDTASLIEALDWLEQKHTDIVNMSLTGPHDKLLQDKIEGMSQKGVLFLAAVGNDGPTAPPTFPSAYEPVLAVTAINKDLSSYVYANRGNHVDLSAPGVGIWTAMPGGKATYHSGTSFAVPYATAVAASIYPDLKVKSKAELLEHMNFVDLGPPGRDPIYGRGLVIAPYACAPERDGPEEASTPPEAMPASSFVTTVSTAGEKPSGLGAPTSPSAGR